MIYFATEFKLTLLGFLVMGFGLTRLALVCEADFFGLEVFPIFYSYSG